MRAADALVIGGGVIGAAVAWRLARAGAAVALVERDEIGAHASGAAAGMLAPISESLGDGAIFSLGQESLARLEAELDELRELSGVDPELVRSGVLRVAASDEEDALRARAQSLAASGCSWVDTRELEKREPVLAAGLAGALFSAREAHVDGRRLARAYAGAAERRGASIARGVEVRGLLREGARVAGARTSQGDWRAHDVVLCTGAWARSASDWLGTDVPVAPVKGQMLALEPVAPRGGPILWSRDVYLVPRRDGELRVGATVERAGFAGLRPGTPDDLPLVGAAPGAPGAWLAAGHYRNGILLAALTGAALASEILEGARLPGLDAFDPARFARENPTRATTT